ncbi:MAG: DNA polymerase III subunit gamma/tau [Candidatus Pacebacteria bacterium]|nr:DNA polymerase III subunit gamma/tau [Candidatus Paceibacterota bacterium]
MVVIYRKYRPKSFSEIVGQEHIVKTITNAIKDEKVSHAYLFYGPRGCGKTTIARLIAKSVNCTGRKNNDFEPCNKCNSCLEVTQGNSIDLIEIDAASNRGIDEIRDLKEGINVVPIKSKYKVYIIDEAHQLTKEASNALLKTLEEPPGYAIFVLCTTEYGKIIPTISSRCQRFEFKKLTLNEITEKLQMICKKEGTKCQREALELIARTSEGAIRDAEGFLNKVISLEDKDIKKEEVESILGIIGIEPIAKLVDFLAQKKEKEAMIYVNDLCQEGVDIENFAKDMTAYLRDLLLVKVNPEIFEKKNIFTKEEEENLKKQERLFSQETLIKILKIFLEAQNQIKWQDLPSLPFELAIIDSVKVMNN